MKCEGVPELNYLSSDQTAHEEMLSTLEDLIMDRFLGGQDEN